MERSRTDPNMLVITYTSEHNHPWPTQRNALAGSTRSQPSKAAAGKTTHPKEEQKEISTDNAAAAPSSLSSQNSTAVKEEADQEFDDSNHHHHHQLEMGDVEAEFDDGFSQSYKPTLPESNLHAGEDSFFADLGEIEADSLDLLFTQGFDGRDSKGLDPFTFYDWASAGSGGGGATSRGEAKRDS